MLAEQVSIKIPVGRSYFLCCFPLTVMCSYIDMKLHYSRHATCVCSILITTTLPSYTISQVWGTWQWTYHYACIKSLFMPELVYILQPCMACTKEIICMMSLVHLNCSNWEVDLSRDHVSTTVYCTS